MHNIEEIAGHDADRLTEGQPILAGGVYLVGTVITPDGKADRAPMRRVGDVVHDRQRTCSASRSVPGRHAIRS